MKESPSHRRPAGSHHDQQRTDHLRADHQRTHHLHVVDATEDADVVGVLADVIASSFVDGPGNRFAIFVQGCQFDCLACHNPQTITVRDDSRATRVRVGDLVGQIRTVAPFLAGITLSGGEATMQPRFVEALLRTVKSDPALAHLTTLLDTNGGCGRDVWDRIEPWLDGAMVDLKCIDPAGHLALTRHTNGEVLASIRHLASVGKLHEVRLLVVPGLTDDAETIRRTAIWLVGIDPHQRVVVQGFRPHGVRRAAREIPAATPDLLELVADDLRIAGLTNVVVRRTPDAAEPA